MATSVSPFSSSEYVMRWLCKIQLDGGAYSKKRVAVDTHYKRKRKPNGSERTLRSDQQGSSVKLQERDLPSRGGILRSREMYYVDEPSHDGGYQDGDRSDSSSSRSPIDSTSNDLNSESLRAQHDQVVDPSKKYARRPRHKTKVDRYEYKGNIAKKSATKKAAMRNNKRSRRKTTGKALNDGFRAPNVEQERLTLKTNTGPGIFGKGKASALLQTCGLPDLTFSEIGFLTKRRRIEGPQLEKQKGLKPAKKRDISKEVSEFFAKPPAATAVSCRTSSEVLQRSSSGEMRERSMSLAPTSPARLASRRKSSLIPASMSPARRHTEEARRTISANDDSTVEVRHSRKHKGPAVGVPTTAVKNTTSRYSWCVTPSRLSPVGEASKLNDLTSTEMIISRFTPRQKVGPIPESSVTNSSLDRYTKYHLLATEDEVWRGSHRAPMHPNVYSLDDLKGLARIAEIEDKYSSRPGTRTARPELQEVMNTSTTSSTVLHREGWLTSETMLPPRLPNHYNTPPIMTASERLAIEHQRPNAHPQDRLASNKAMHSTGPKPVLQDYFLHNEENLYELNLHDNKQHRYQRFYNLDRHFGIDVDTLDEQNEQANFFENESRLPRGQGGTYPASEPESPFTIPHGADQELDLFVSNEPSPENEIPELQGLRYESNRGDAGIDPRLTPEMQSEGYGYEQGEYGMASSRRDLGQVVVWNDGREGLVWHTPSSLCPVKSDVEEQFFGFSRPQILY